METMKNNLEVIARYTDQPGVMPDSVREKIEETFGGEPIQLYALADLDGKMQLAAQWFALGPKQIAIYKNGTTEGQVNCFDRSQIEELREIHGLSCTTLSIMGEPGEPPLATVRYTHRQRRAMENIKFVVEQQLKGMEVNPDEPDLIYSSSVAHAVKDAQAAVNPSKMSVIWRLCSYLKPYKRAVIIGTASATLITVTDLIPPKLIGYLINDVITPFQAGELASDSAMKSGWTVIAILATIFVVREIAAFIRLRKMAYVGEYVARDLRNHIYGHIQSLSMNYFSKKQTGSIISRVSSDTDRLWDFIAFGMVETSLSILMLMGLSVMLLSMDFWLGLIIVGPMPIFIWVLIDHGRRMKRVFLNAWRKWSKLMEVLSDTIPGIQVVKAFNQEEYEKERFGLRNANCLETFTSIHDIWTRFWPCFMFSFNVIVVTVWGFALPRVLNGDQAEMMEIGDFVAFIMYMGLFVPPLHIIGQMTRMMNRSLSSAHRIFEVLDTEPEIVDIQDSIKLEPVKGRVTFDNVTFAYDGVRQIIKSISFDVQPGEMIGLVGPSGAGKSTITNLIARFHDCSGGKIMVDGVDLRDLDCGHYRKQVGMVLQEPYLFHGTILENIRYGVQDATIEQVMEAARTANAHDFICKFAHGYDTTVGERGQTLSGGERQRISIARAILCDPRILILDEATSSVDTEAERKIQEALERLTKGRTVFAIAHRLSTLRRATRLFVIEDGHITEEGNHSELLEKEDGTYRKLYNLQQELHDIYAV